MWGGGGRKGLRGTAPGWEAGTSPLPAPRREKFTAHLGLLSPACVFLLERWEGSLTFQKFSPTSLEKHHTSKKGNIGDREQTLTSLLGPCVGRTLLGRPGSEASQPKGGLAGTNVDGQLARVWKSIIFSNLISMISVLSWSFSFSLLEFPPEPPPHTPHPDRWRILQSILKFTSPLSNGSQLRRGPAHGSCHPSPTRTGSRPMIRRRVSLYKSCRVGWRGSRGGGFERLALLVSEIMKSQAIPA